jgi:thymidine kinase
MSLFVFTGGMFCGKTTKLLQEVGKFSDLSEKNKALIINNSIDIRNQEHIVSSHSSLYKGLNGKINVISVSSLSDVNVDEYSVIGIDEANFFDDLVPVVKKWLTMKKNIICVGLDGDYKMERFGNISELLPLSDSFIKLTAICSDCLVEILNTGENITPFNMTPAPFTAKIKKNDQLIDIGGNDKYAPVCRKHHRLP